MAKTNYGNFAELRKKIQKKKGKKVPKILDNLSSEKGVSEKLTKVDIGGERCLLQS